MLTPSPATGFPVAGDRANNAYPTIGMNCAAYNIGIGEQPPPRGLNYFNIEKLQ